MDNIFKPHNYLAAEDDEVTVSGSTCSVRFGPTYAIKDHRIWVADPLPSVWSKKIQIGRNGCFGMSMLAVVHGRESVPFKNTPFGVSVSADYGDVFNGIGDESKLVTSSLHFPYHSNKITNVFWHEETKQFTVKFGTNIVTGKFPEESLGHHEYYFCLYVCGIADISVTETVSPRVNLLLRNRFLVLSGRASVEDVPLSNKTCLMVVQVVPLWFLQKICTYLVE